MGLQRLFSHPHKPETIQRIAGARREVLELVRQSNEIGERVKEELGLDLSKHRQG